MTTKKRTLVENLEKDLFAKIAEKVGKTEFPANTLLEVISTASSFGEALSICLSKSKES